MGMDRCSQHSGLEERIDTLAGEMGRVRDTVERIWQSIDQVRDTATAGDVERRVSDAKRATQLSAWRAATVVLGLITAGLGLGIKFGVW